MNEHHMKGSFDEVAGRVQSAAGALAGDATDELAGKAREARAQLEGTYGDAVDTVRNAGQTVSRMMRTNPMISVLVAAAAGYFLGRSMHRD